MEDIAPTNQGCISREVLAQSQTFFLNSCNILLEPMGQYFMDFTIALSCILARIKNEGEIWTLPFIKFYVVNIYIMRSRHKSHTQDLTC